MSLFKFNFNSETAQELGDDEKEEVHWLESSKIVPDENIKEIVDAIDHAKMFVYRDVEISHVIATDVVKTAKDYINTAVHYAEQEHSDLVEGKYEGGLKIWECTRDLLEYMVDNGHELKLENSRVLDLGCGAGILGIYTFKNGSHTTFQDYNKEVLECVTIPNVILNIEENEDSKTELFRCRFYSGDWASFNKILPETEIFDMILTSETIYNPCNYKKLIDLFTKRLSLNGCVYLAAKSHYFAVGGGTKQFEAIIEDTSLLKSEVCWKSSGGIQREIMRITRKIL